MSIPGPTVLVLGDISDASLELAAGITVAYSDVENQESCEVGVIGKGKNLSLAKRGRDKQEFGHYMI